MMLWLAGSTFSNWMPMPTRRSLHATRPSASMSRLEPGIRKRTLIFEPLVERARRPDRDAAVTQVERQRRGDGVAEAVLDGNAEHHARTAAAVEVVGKQMRRERGQDVLHGAVLVDVAGDAERGELAHLVGVGDRAAEDQNRQPAVVELADRAHQIDARRMGSRRSRTIRSMVARRREAAPAVRRALLTASALCPAVSSAVLKPVADKRRIVGDENRLRRERSAGHQF